MLRDGGERVNKAAKSHFRVCVRKRIYGGRHDWEAHMGVGIDGDVVEHGCMATWAGICLPRARGAVFKDPTPSNLLVHRDSALRE